MDRPLVVTYDRGAATATEIAVGLARLVRVVFLAGRSEHVRRVAEVLRRLGQTMPLTGDLATDTAALRQLDPAAILTFSEPMLPVTARLAAALGLPFHSIATMKALTDKRLQRERLRRCGVDDVRSCPVSSMEQWDAVRDVVGLPAVVKPVHGQGSHDTHLVTDDETARLVLTRLLSGRGTATVVVEEFLAGRPSGPFGDYVSVESYRGTDGIRHFAVTGKLPLAPPFRETGRFWPAALTPADRAAVTDLVGRALVALDVGPGLTHSEVKLTADGPRIIEVNGRLGGHVNGLARQAADLDLVRLAGLLALGRPVELPAAPDRPGRVHFQHNTLAPVGPCELVSLRGDTQVRRLDAVRGFRAYARPGDVFTGGVMTRHLDLLWGDCPRHADMVDALDEAGELLSYEFRFPDGPCRLSARDLRKGGSEAAAS